MAECEAYIAEMRKALTTDEREQIKDALNDDMVSVEDVLKLKLKMIGFSDLRKGSEMRNLVYIQHPVYTYSISRFHFSYFG
jgi:hypothetical protein